MEDVIGGDYLEDWVVKWEGNIKVDLTDLNWIELAQVSGKNELFTLVVVNLCGW
jgi:hypothetical protein